MTRILISAFVLVLAVAGRSPAADDAAGFRWVNHPEQGTADLLDGGRPALRYMFAFDRSSPTRTEETFKVYHHLFGPGSDDLLTKGPGGLYTHHRGLFVGWMKTVFDGGQIDSWHCKAGAHQRHVRFVEQKADRDSGSMTSEISWNTADGQPVIDELRTVRLARFAGAKKGPPAWQIDWTSQLQSRRGKIELAGDRQHAGFQFRAAQSVAAANSAVYIRPKGFPQEPKAFEVDDRKNPHSHVNLGWLAMTFPINGTEYTVAYFEDPSLPKPSLYSERPYGRFGAYFKTTLAPERPLTLRYRLIVASGAAPSREKIQSEYDQFVADLAGARQSRLR